MATILTLSWIKQISSFGTVGLLATFTHALVFELAFTIISLSSLMSNVIGFCGAFAVSFCGHFCFTFRNESREVGGLRWSALRFLLVSLLGLFLNLIGGVLLIDMLQLHRIFFITYLFVVAPTFVFVINKFWVFRPRVSDHY